MALFKYRFNAETILKQWFVNISKTNFYSFLALGSFRLTAKIISIAFRLIHGNCSDMFTRKAIGLCHSVSTSFLAAAIWAQKSPTISGAYEAIKFSFMASYSISEASYRPPDSLLFHLHHNLHWQWMLLCFLY